ncbi:hypothetical protein [Leptothoe sp. PORK10 BA2]|nr:hypothetical protein [Leptothoe sp. PORK10 BA2]MEA5464646.1 hypothetical protein [Leptothoe sp. PORK10 BA2]
MSINAQPRKGCYIGVLGLEAKISPTLYTGLLQKYLAVSPEQVKSAIANI